MTSASATCASVRGVERRRGRGSHARGRRQSEIKVLWEVEGRIVHVAVDRLHRRDPPSSRSTLSRPTSPAWRINSTPSSAASASGRIRPCVSEMSPIRNAAQLPFFPNTCLSNQPRCAGGVRHGAGVYLTVTGRGSRWGTAPSCLLPVSEFERAEEILTTSGWWRAPILVAQDEEQRRLDLLDVSDRGAPGEVLRVLEWRFAEYVLAEEREVGRVLKLAQSEMSRWLTAALKRFVWVTVQLVGNPPPLHRSRPGARCRCIPS